MNKTISLIFLLLIGFGVNVAAADNTVKTSFVTFTLTDGWQLESPQKPESKAQADYSGVTIKQKMCTLYGPDNAEIIVARYETGKSANIDGVKAYIQRMQEAGNRERICNLKWEYDQTRNMWIGTDEKVTASNLDPNVKIARKDVIYLQTTGKYIDVFWVHLTKSAVNNSEIAKQIDAIFKSWTPKPVKK